MGRRISPALVLSVLAIVLATTAGATAASSLITGKQIKNSSITGADIKDRSVGADDIKSLSIGPSKISDGLAADIEAGKTNVPGPAGPAGPAGAPGAAGPAGPAGSTNIVTVTSPHQTLPPGGYTSSMRAICPAGTVVVGTGFNTGIGNADLVASYGTFVGGFIDNDTSITIEAYVQAICASGAADGGGTRALRLDGDDFVRDEAAARAGLRR
jgi:hypothetical protein